MAEELRSCPFCGAKAEVWQDNVCTWGLIEHEPDCWLAYDIPRHKQEIPRAEFASWNSRATTPDTTCRMDETETYECVRDDMGGYGKRLTVHVMECGECGHTFEHVNGSYEFCPHCRKVVDE